MADLDLKQIIPTGFYHSDSAPHSATNVGELIEQLKKLPSHLPINSSRNSGCIVTVFNINADAFVEIEELRE
ncbi:MAG: hypothetical protein HAW67_07415 [Endozoicomonadaceae bacterium]|nr:hypothetical protein [Endozoicomonadaceae bacterium]